MTDREVITSFDTLVVVFQFFSRDCPRYLPRAEIAPLSSANKQHMWNNIRTLRIREVQRQNSKQGRSIRKNYNQVQLPISLYRSYNNIYFYFYSRSCKVFISVFFFFLYIISTPFLFDVNFRNHRCLVFSDKSPRRASFSILSSLVFFFFFFLLRRNLEMHAHVQRHSLRFGVSARAGSVNFAKRARVAVPN